MDSAAEHDPVLLHEQLQQVTAAYQNYRKRAAQEGAQIALRSVRDILNATLPVIDDLARAIQTCPDANTRLGLQLILRSYEQALRGAQITTISCENGYDPYAHEAIAQIQIVGVRPGTIVSVQQAGWQWQNNIIRPSKVIIAC